MDGIKYWWLPASIAFGPAFMVLAPRLVDNGLVQMAFIVAGCMMQVGVNMYLFGKIRDHDKTNG